jgi:hypothetical protein
MCRRRSATRALACLLAATVPAIATAQEFRLHAVTDSGLDLEQRSGGLDKAFITESAGSGAAFLDYDVDGTLDVVLVNGLAGPGASVSPAHPALAAGRTGAGHRLYRGDGTRFAAAPAAAGVRQRVWGSAVTWGDVDNDGWPDLFIAAIGPDQLYRNNGDGTFTAWPRGVEDAGWGAAATFTDWDSDGILDLYVARYVDLAASSVTSRGEGRCFYSGVSAFCGPEGLAGQRDRLYRGLADATFVDWPSARIDADAGFGLAVLAFDCDDDGAAEIYVANDSTMNLLYRRDGDGDIDEQALLSGAGYSADGREQAGMGVTSADFDGDGQLDLFVTNFQNDHNTLYRNLGGCVFQDETDLRQLAASSFPYMGWSALFLDLDGDADQDLFVANGHIHPAQELQDREPYGQRNLMYRNELRESDAAVFTEVGSGARDGLATVASSRGAVRGDYDNDGDTDLLVTNIDATPTLLRNDSPARYPALRLTLVGRSANRSARGATVVVTSAGVAQRLEVRDSDGYAGANDGRLLVYLPSGAAERIEIRWPGRGVMVLEHEPPGDVLVDQTRGVVARAALR